jgi:hypothetical protein
MWLEVLTVKMYPKKKKSAIKKKSILGWKYGVSHPFVWLVDTITVLNIERENQGTTIKGKLTTSEDWQNHDTK